MANLKAWREHAGGNDQVGDDEARHAEGEEYRLAGVFDTSVHLA